MPLADYTNRKTLVEIAGKRVMASDKAWPDRSDRCR